MRAPTRIPSPMETLIGGLLRDVREDLSARQNVTMSEVAELAHAATVRAVMEDIDHPFGILATYLIETTTPDMVERESAWEDEFYDMPRDNPLFRMRDAWPRVLGHFSEAVAESIVALIREDGL
jgi:hypothetical protein